MPKGTLFQFAVKLEMSMEIEVKGLEIRLNLIAGSIAVTGRFSYSIPDANGAIQVVYIYLL